MNSHSHTLLEIKIISNFLEAIRGTNEDKLIHSSVFILIYSNNQRETQRVFLLRDVHCNYNLQEN